MHHAAIHPLTPGSPAYALAKMGAVGALFALRTFLVRRDGKTNPPEEADDPSTTEALPHPVSHRKARRSRKRR